MASLRSLPNVGVNVAVSIKQKLRSITTETSPKIVCLFVESARLSARIHRACIRVIVQIVYCSFQITATFQHSGVEYMLYDHYMILMISILWCFSLG